MKFSNWSCALATASIAAITVSLTASAKPVTFKVDDNRDVVSFTSDAPLELIMGRTGNVKGNVTIDESLDLSKQPLQAQFEVDLASIDTGIPLRNEHMRDNFLETGKYPKAVFKLTTLQKAGVLKPGQKSRLMATGDFTLHGKTVKKTVPVDVTYFAPCAATKPKKENCELLQISAEFPVPFADHAIKRPEVVFQKLTDTVIVKIASTAYRQVMPASKASAAPAKTMVPAVKVKPAATAVKAAPAKAK